MQQYQEGQTATNPQTGQKVVYRDGQWRPVGPTPNYTVAPTDTAATNAFNADMDMITAAREEVNQFRDIPQNLRRFIDINEGQRTGGMQHQSYEGLSALNPLNWPGMAAQALTRPNLDPDIQMLNAITGPLQGLQRPVGSGATSDFEQRLYRQGVPSVEKRGPANMAIANTQIGVIEAESDRVDFLENYLTRNGTLNGSEQAWQAYVRENPYTIPRDYDGGRTSVVVPNENRVDWRGYFGMSRPEGNRAPPAAPSRAQAQQYGQGVMNDFERRTMGPELYEMVQAERARQARGAGSSPGGFRILSVE